MTSIGSAKGRAIVARLLACLVPVVVLAGGTSALAASPPSPKLVTTDPVSTADAPAGSATPAVLGEAEPEDGIIRESLPIGEWPVMFSVPRAVEKPTKHPEYEIQIFNGPGCEGAPIATGSAQALEEVGIAVNVAADAKTTLSAIQIDPLNLSQPSPCSNPLSYWEGNVPPEEVSSGGGGDQAGGGGDSTGGGSEGTGAGPGQGKGGSSSGGSISKRTPAGGKPEAPHIHLSPAERSNELTPLVVGNAPGADSVSIYASANCSGKAVVAGPAAQLSSGFTVPVPENSTTTFTAVAIAAQRSSCSSSVTYTEDSTAPKTRITMGPSVKTRKLKAVFRFKDATEDPPGTTFRCKVNKAKWKPCSSPFRLKHLKHRRYVIKIRATDLAGNVEPNAVKRRFTVVPGVRR
jgi:hypothetical protein